jgi:CHAD domain-containing protein
MTRSSSSKGRDHRKLEEVVVDLGTRREVDGWIRDVQRRYGVQEEPPVNETSIFFDTADGRLFDNGIACSSTGGVIRLDSFETSGREVRAVVDPCPRFAVDFPEGKLRDALMYVAEDRALLEVLRMSTNRRCWRILDPELKTVARVVLEDIEVCDETQSTRLGPFLVLKPVRGYERMAEEVERWIDEQSFERLEGPVYLQALKALHKTPKGNPTGSRTKLTASMPAGDAVRILLKSLYEVVRVNESGVLADTDAECLHDYRVAIRKARSLTRQTRGVFASGPTKQFRDSLAWLGRSTNTLRDLDVYLLHRQEYGSWLGTAFDKGLEPLFAFVQAARDKAFQELAGVIKSPEYADVLSGWNAFAEGPGIPGLGPKGLEAIGTLARKRIAKQCRRVLEAGYLLTDATPPNALHGLRIECKHLRYLIEFFTDFVPEAKHVIRRMKKLQDALGAIQDFTVQEERLRDYLEGAEIRKESPLASAATEELIKRVREERDSERDRVLKLFARFNRSLRESEPPYAILLPWLHGGS